MLIFWGKDLVTFYNDAFRPGHVLVDDLHTSLYADYLAVKLHGNSLLSRSTVTVDMKG